MLMARNYQTAVTYAILGVAAFFALFYRLGASPIFLWDEARVANNSLEMMQAANVLVVTYKGEPDIWSSKPPGAIWLFALSMKAFGIHEWSLRLPSAIAGLVTVITTFAFVKHITQSQVTALLGSLILLATAGYVGTHGTRTADFDAILVFFNTGAVLSVFLALESQSAKGQVSATWLYAAAACAAAAVLTKGVAGLLFAPGLGAYVLARGKLRPMLQSPAAWLACGIVILVTLSFYLAREAAAPGYFKAVWVNELGGRMGGAIEGHSGPWTFHLNSFVSVDWLRSLSRPVEAVNYRLASAFPWSLLLPFALAAGGLSREAQTRRACLLIGLCLASYIWVISSAATKIAWYLALTYPFTAIAVALGAREIWGRLRSSRMPPLQRTGHLLPMISVLVALSFVGLVGWKNARIADAAGSIRDAETSYFAREVFAQYPRLSNVIIVHNGHDGHVSAIRDGVIVGSERYSGPERFYAIARSRRGFDTRVEPSAYDANIGETVIGCGSIRSFASRSSRHVLIERDRCVALTYIAPL